MAGVPPTRHCPACRVDSPERVCPQCGGRTIVVLKSKAAAASELEGISASTRPLATGPGARSRSRLGFGASSRKPGVKKDGPPTVKMAAVEPPPGSDWGDAETIPPPSADGLEVLPPLPARARLAPRAGELPASARPVRGAGRRLTAKAPAAQPARDAGTRLDFELTLSGCKKEAPTARIWVDANRDGQMDAEEEIRPLQKERLTWRGTYQLPGETSRQIGFRVVMEGSVGCRWRLRVWSDQPRRHMVYEQVDRMQRASERVIGWCEG